MCVEIAAEGSLITGGPWIGETSCVRAPCRANIAMRHNSADNVHT